MFRRLCSRRWQPREGEWELWKRSATDCEGGPGVRRISQLASKRKKEKKKNIYRDRKYARVRLRESGRSSRSREVMVPFMVSESAVALNEE